MRVHLLAAATTLGLVAWGGPVHGQTASDTSANTAGAGQTAAADTDVKTQKGSDLSAWNVRHALSEATEDALSKDGFDNLVGRLADPDRERIKQGGDINKDQPDLQAKVEQVNKAWKEKFGHDFKVRDSKDVFADATIEKGEIGKTPTLASEVTKNSEQGATEDKSARKEDMDKGRDIAVASLPAVESLPAIRVPLIHEHLMTWKINVPDRVSYQKLHDNLIKHLDTVADSSKWPADEKQAEKVIAHHVLMAVLDIDDSGGGQETAQPAAAREPGEPAAPTPPDTAAPAPDTSTPNRQ